MCSFEKGLCYYVTGHCHELWRMCGSYEICGICFLIEELFQVCGSGSKSDNQVFLLSRMATVMRSRGQGAASDDRRLGFFVLPLNMEQLEIQPEKKGSKRL